jgi:hypothetical protein
MVIRIATPADAATLAAISLKTFVDTFAPHNTAENLHAYTSIAFTEEKQRAELEAPNVVTLFAEDDGNAIAYAQIRKTPARRTATSSWRVSTSIERITDAASRRC